MKLPLSLTGRSAAKWLPLVLLFLALSIYLPTVAKGRVVNDCHAAAASAWRIASTGRPWMDDVDVRKLEGSPWSRTWLIEDAQGHRVYNRTAGVMVASVPFYAVLNRGLDEEGFEIWVAGVAAATYTAMAGVMLFLALRHKVGNRLSLGASAVFLFATPMWSVSANAMWTHSLTALAITGAIWAATRSRWWALGAFMAIGILARPHVAIIAAVVGLYLGWRRRDWMIVARVGLSSAVGTLVLLVWNRLVFGGWSLSGGYSNYVTDAVTQIPSGGSLLFYVANTVGFLIAPDRGLLVWTPMILLLLPSLMASWRHLPDWVRAFVIGGIAYSVVQLRINEFTGGQGYYGYRLALELLACLAPALVYTYRVVAPWTRVALAALIGLQFAAFSLGAIRDEYHLKVSEVWTNNAYVAAVSERPLALGLFTLVCVAAGALFMGRATFRSSKTVERVSV